MDFKETLISRVVSLLQELGEIEKAQGNYLRALQIDEVMYGPNHHRVANVLYLLAGVLEEMGESEAAEEAESRADQIVEVLEGEDSA